MDEGEVENDEELVAVEFDKDDPPYEDDGSLSQRRDSYKRCLKREAKAGGKHAFYYVQKFRKEWLEIEEFKKWIQEVPGDVTKVRCSWCQRILNARLNDLKRHIKTKKHMVLSDQVLAGLNYVKASPEKSKASSDNLNCSKTQFLSILNDISAMEENNINGDEAAPLFTYEEPAYERSFTSCDMSKVIKEHSEMNRLLHNLINVQKERLSVERERLETEKKQLLVQKEMVHVLNEKLTIATAP